jgi:hypothetical protein
VSSEQLQELLTPYLVAAEGRMPGAMAMIKGMSVGAMAPVLELFAVNAFEELEPLLETPEGELDFLQRKEGYRKPPALPTERCSSFTISHPGVTMLAHNEHWLAGDLGNVAVVIEIPPPPAVAIASPTIVCCLPAVGMNGLGGAQGIGSLTAEEDGVGIPRVMVSRHSLEAADRQDAVRRAGLEGRAGGYGHSFAFAGGDTMVIETTATREAVLPGGVHTNHYIDPELAATAPEPSEGSRARHERLTQLLADRQPTTPEDVMEILRDHGSSPQAICLHPDPTEGEEASAVLFSMVADVERGRMWVAPGNPCVTPYEEIDLTGVR